MSPATQHLQSVVGVPSIDRDSDLAPVVLGQHFQITAAGLSVVGEPSFETCQTLWSALRTLEKSLAFAIGDAIRYFEARWGERASQIIDVTGLSYETCRNYRWIAEKVSSENRMIDRGLSMAHHQLVARLQPPEQRRWLKRAASEDAEPWTVARLRAAIREGGDTAPTAWFAVVRCNSEDARDSLVKRLESEGFACKATERR